MMPIGPLMIEHRLIERMINILNNEFIRMQNERYLNPIFIDNVVDFIRTYADQTHHGKEEDILFRELEKKELSEEHEKIMKELIEEHKFGRKITGELVEARKKYVKGELNAIEIVIKKIKTLIDFYPKHIEKEDKHFFVPVMDYFSKEQQNKMLREEQEFDRKMIHKKYDSLVTNFENERNIQSKDSKSNWIKYV